MHRERPVLLLRGGCQPPTIGIALRLRGRSSTTAKQRRRHGACVYVGGGGAGAGGVQGRGGGRAGGAPARRRAPPPPRATPAPRAQVKVQPPELKGFMDKKLSGACSRCTPACSSLLSAEPALPPPPPAVHLNANRHVTGVLRGFDQFMNLVLDAAVDEKLKVEIGMVVSGWGGSACVCACVRCVRAGRPPSPAPRQTQVIRGASVVTIEALERVDRTIV